MNSPALQDCVRDWGELQENYQDIQETHRLYKQKLEELAKLQTRCSGTIARQKKKLKELSVELKKYKSSVKNVEEEEEQISVLNNQIRIREKTFFEMESFLPKKNGLYLSLVLGNVNVTLLSKQSKFAYKDEYEKFKLYLTMILMVLSFICRFVLNSRVTDAVFNFLLVWYYCTLTIRESILINNGSRKESLLDTQVVHCTGFVQFLQYYYQSGCLYRLRALGERHNMDLTVEGFQSWMWRGLTFLLPFLFFGQFWQLYNAITLFKLARHPECKEWQVIMCGLPFLVHFLGNFFTTLRVVHQKFQKQN
eukprot:XP_017946707.1 PREDICTED: transmembrane protein 120A isoform X3 [Xenopus tropicalis]